MSMQRIVYRATHGFLAFFLVFLILLSNLGTVLAAPNQTSEQTNTGWVDIHAHVPEGFRGSVSVLLERKTTGETHIITSYYLNDYVNSVEIPLGDYLVVSAFTSEDSFIYEAFTATEKLTLKDSAVIEVTVTYNPEGEGILTNLNQYQPDQASEDSTQETSEDTSVSSEESPKEQTVPSDVEEGSDITENTETETESKEDTSESVANRVRNILLSVAVTLAFLILFTLLAVYVRCKLDGT